jgi:hypothetical protein
MRIGRLACIAPRALVELVSGNGGTMARGSTPSSVITLWLALAATGVACSEDASTTGGTGGAAGAVGSDASVGGTSGTGGLSGASGADSGAACAPVPLGSWTPTWKAPTGIHQAKCTEAEIDELLPSCVNMPEPPACEATKAKYANCAACMFTDDTQAQLGPMIHFVSSTHYRDRNVGGCLALLSGDTSATSCGARVNAAYDCAVAACAPGCKLDDFSDLVSFNACADAASDVGGECKAYADAADACVAQLKAQPDGAKYSSCLDLSGGTFPSFKSITLVFCGPATDGG